MEIENNINNKINEEKLVSTSGSADKSMHLGVQEESLINKTNDLEVKSLDKTQDLIENEENSDDVIDLSEVKNKVKNFFKSSNKKKETKKEHKIDYAIKDGVSEDDEISLDFKKLSNFTKNNSKWIIPLFLILIAILVSTHFRMMSSDLPITDEWAENSVNSYYKQNIAAQISQQYPNLPSQNKQALAEKEYQKVLDENKDQIERDIGQLSSEYKSYFKDDNGDTYLLAIDPYLWYSEARNVINHGHLGDTIIDGESYFSLRDGRLDKKSTFQLHPYIAAYTYKLLSIFNPNISLMRALFLLPAIIIGLALIPTFFIGRKLGGNIGGFFAAMFLAVNGSLLSRTPAGFSDTDPYSILFPVMVVWLFFEAYNAKTLKYKILLSSLAGLFSGLYAATWTGWTHIFWFVNIAIFLAILFNLIMELIKHKNKFNLNIFKNKNLKNKFLILICFIISTGIFVSMFSSSARFFNSFNRIVQFITLKQVGIKSIWPNVLTTVAEFNTISFSNIISQMGGKLLFWISLMGLVFLLIDRKKFNKINGVYVSLSALYYLIMLSMKDKISDPFIFLIILSIPVIVGLLKILYEKEDIKIVYPLFLIIWFIGSAYAFTKGTRFALLASAPVSIALGSALGFIYSKSVQWINKGINLEKKLTNSLVFIVLALLLISPITAAQGIAKNEIPSMNDNWFNTLTKIKDNTADAVITSWWDFGHWFVAVSERRVTFDGGDQGKRIHWVGRTLLSNDEQETIGVLRMLNCAQETAPAKLDEFTSDSLESVDILYKIFQINDRDEAYQKYIELGLESEEAQTMLDYTHCEDLIDNYYITSEDMVGKAGVWGHFGSWDFEKASMYQNTNKLSRNEAISYLIENFDLSEEEADQIHYEIQNNKGDQWISPWPGYHTGFSSCSSISEVEIGCQVSIDGNGVNFNINLEAMDVNIENNPNLKPNSIVYASEDGIEEKIFSNSSLIGSSIILLPNGDGNFKIMLSDQLQAASTFTKLFFFEGHGVECFSKFDDVQQLIGGRIITWEVDYDCQQENKVFFPSSELEEDEEEIISSE